MAFFGCEDCPKRNVEMLETETGTLVVDARAWKQFVATMAPLEVATPSSFPVIAYPIRHGNNCPSTLLVVTPGQVNALLATPAEINHVNDFAEGEISGVRVLEDEQVACVDDRGWLAEVARSDEDGAVPMAYVSLTRPGITRGPHEHRNQTDRFLLIGQVTVWLWDNREGATTHGVCQRIIINGVAKVVIPPGVVHAYRNDARLNNLTVVNAPDRLYKGPNRQLPVDEVRHEDDPHTKFKPW